MFPGARLPAQSSCSELHGYWLILFPLIVSNILSSKMDPLMRKRIVSVRQSVCSRNETGGVGKGPQTKTDIGQKTHVKPRKSSIFCRGHLSRKDTQTKTATNIRLKMLVKPRKPGIFCRAHFGRKHPQTSGKSQGTTTQYSQTNSYRESK